MEAFRLQARRSDAEPFQDARPSLQFFGDLRMGHANFPVEDVDAAVDDFRYVKVEIRVLDLLTRLAQVR